MKRVCLNTWYTLLVKVPPYEKLYFAIQPYIQILLAILDTTHISFVSTTVSLMLI